MRPKNQACLIIFIASTVNARSWRPIVFVLIVAMGDNGASLP